MPAQPEPIRQSGKRSGASAFFDGTEDAAIQGGKERGRAVEGAGELYDFGNFEHGAEKEKG